MRDPTYDEIAGQLVAIISDGFNRSIGALEDAGVSDHTDLSRYYKGVGSKYYDLVTEQIERTARSCAPAIRKLFLGGPPE